MGPLVLQYLDDGDHLFARVDVEGNQTTQEKALTVLEELGLTRNGEQPTTYEEDRRPPLDVTGGRDDNGRIFRIEQLAPDSGVVASFPT